MSSASFRFRYLLGVLCHVVLALVACWPLPHPDENAAIILSTCGVEPSFVDATKLKRWERFPVDVHIDLSALPPHLEQLYREGIEKGVAVWEKATAGRIGVFRIHDDRPNAPVRLRVSPGRLPDNALGSTELTFTENLIVRAEVQLTRSQFERTAFLVNDVANTTAHEIGHVLGIVDHSPFDEDKMWVAGNFGIHNQAVEPARLLTVRDVNTLLEAYCR